MSKQRSYAFVFIKWLENFSPTVGLQPRNKSIQFESYSQNRITLVSQRIEANREYMSFQIRLDFTECLHFPFPRSSRLFDILKEPIYHDGELLIARKSRMRSCSGGVTINCKTSPDNNYSPLFGTLSDPEAWNLRST